MLPSEGAYSEVERLVRKFKALSTRERRAHTEEDTCKGFILPLFHALDWKTGNAAEVSAEVKVSRGWVDYAFRLGGIPRFFLEAKRVTEDLTDPRWVKQAIDYAWTKSVTWALLSDFEGLRVFNAEFKEANPIHAEVLAFSVETYLSDFERLWWLSRTEMAAGTLDRWAEANFKKTRKEPVSQHLFDDLKEWRRELFRHLQAYNRRYSSAQIDEAVLRILNRLIFLRTAEDREVEREKRLLPLLRELTDRGQLGHLPDELAKLFRVLDAVYDSDLFAEHFSEKLDCEPEPFRILIEGLHEKRGGYVRYNFNAIDADVLGTVYEQYLGHVITNPEAAEVVEKSAKRKSQGIYYTPTFVVKYIIQQTLGRHLQEHGYNPSRPVRVLDMACGSGSFLIEALDVLDRHVAQLREQTRGDREDVRDYACRMELLTQCIYGVDKDEQAVAVARLNLLLKALHERGQLPMLKNIRSGDSLISGAPEELKAAFGKDWKEKKQFNWEKEFPEVCTGGEGGFDVIVGNPPYFNIETLGKQSPDAAWIKSRFPEVWMDKSDVLFYFIARAIQLLRGRMAFIVSRAFLEADKAQRLRQFILDHCSIETVIDFQDFQVFEEANISTAIIVLRREPVAEHRRATATRVAKIHVSDGNGAELMRTIESRLSETVEYTSTQFSVFDYPQARLTSKAWAFVPPDRDALFARVDNGHMKLGEVCFVGEGMQTGANDVFEVDMPTIRREQLERKWLCKHAANSDIRRYLLEHSGTWLIWVEDAEKFTDCPVRIAAYLKAHKAKLKKRAAYVRGNCEWYKFTWPLHRDWYSQPKIIVPYRAPENRFALDNSAEYIGLTDTTVIFKHKGDQHDLRYYLALLNSRLITFRFRGIGKMTGSGMYEYFENSVGQLPIHRINFSDPAEKAQHDAIVALVEEMLAVQKDYAEAEREKEDRRHALKRRIEAVDAEIDRAVYALYGLTEEEIRVVMVSTDRERINRWK
jgi:type I restriction-modification system DNA methylase subunit